MDVSIYKKTMNKIKYNGKNSRNGKLKNKKIGQAK